MVRIGYLIIELTKKENVGGIKLEDLITKKELSGTLTRKHNG